MDFRVAGDNADSPTLTAAAGHLPGAGPVVPLATEAEVRAYVDAVNANDRHSVLGGVRVEGCRLVVERTDDPRFPNWWPSHYTAPDGTPLYALDGWPWEVVPDATSPDATSPDTTACDEAPTPALVREFADIKCANARGDFTDARYARLDAVVFELRARGVLD